MSILSSTVAAGVGAALAAIAVDVKHRSLAAFVGALGGAAVLYAIERPTAAAGPGIPLNARARIVAPMRPGAA